MLLGLYNTSRSACRLPYASNAYTFHGLSFGRSAPPATRLGLVRGENTLLTVLPDGS